MDSIINDLNMLLAMNKNKTSLTLRVMMKEYLQNYVLDFIYSSPKYKGLIFYGGTCLRKIYNLDRMSEDLDFEVLTDIDLNLLGKDITDYFSKSVKHKGVDFKYQSSEMVERLTLKFSVLKELGLSQFNDENLHIKVETVRVNEVFATQITPLPISRFSMLVKHYDLPTLMASKITACLSRTFKKGDTGIFIKGRDFYDLIWYMQKSIEPNEKRLKHANPDYNIKNVFDLLDDKIKLITFDDLYTDLSPYFEREEYIKEWCNNFHNFYNRLRINYQ